MCISVLTEMVQVVNQRYIQGQYEPFRVNTVLSLYYNTLVESSSTCTRSLLTNFKRTKASYMYLCVCVLPLDDVVDQMHVHMCMCDIKLSVLYCPKH